MCVYSSEKRIHSKERESVCVYVWGEIKGFTIDTLKVQSHAMCIAVHWTWERERNWASAHLNVYTDYYTYEFDT